MSHPTLSLTLAVAALLLIVAGLVIDHLEAREDRIAQTHDVEVLPGGRLLHLSFCWCRCQQKARKPRRR